MDTKFTAKSEQISKTVIFFDSKKNAYAAMQKCRRWLQKSDKHKYSKKQVRKTIKIFQCNTFKFDKKTVIAEFQKLNKNSSVHMIFVTETLELDVNLSDVQHVILHGFLKEWDPAILWQ